MEIKVKRFKYPVLIHSVQIKELKKIEETNGALKIGASVTLVEMESALKQQIKAKPG